ncbi:MAG: deoxyuridine 5'-triphosphate nucleotidohydrolase [Lachnospiraceae bacterium]|nr:deoxyuridine 5'-triphosphate nucleotidohydrolase [Lachnospiraceae bacterium]
MQRIAKFEKVSYDQFQEDWLAAYPQAAKEEIQAVYERIRLPKRATSGSAGYDFFTPCSFTLKPGETIKILSGIRVRIDEGWVLKLYPRSGLGFKYRLQLNNTVGVIDSDYYHSDNEGHIQIKLTNDSKEGKTLTADEGTGIVQGIFVGYGITTDDETTEVRNGGFGSTTAGGV